MSRKLSSGTRTNNRSQWQFFAQAIGTGIMLGVLLTDAPFLSKEPEDNAASVAAQGIATSSTSEDLGQGQATVHWLNFEARQQPRSALLRWATRQERNCDYFQIERAIDEGDYVPVGKISAHGSSSMLHEYQFADRSLPELDSAYLQYRLRPVGLRKGAAPSPPIELDWISDPADFWVQAQPNPAFDSFQVQLKGQGKYQMHILTAGGDVVRKDQIDLAGSHSIAFDADEWNKGLYLIRVEGPQGRKTTGVWLR
jgi:hypothetical protein